MAHDPKSEERINEVRRRLLRASAVAGGALALGQIPYSKPALKSFFGTREAYAQVTLFSEINAAGQLGMGPVGFPESTGQDCYQFSVPTANTTLTITVTPDPNLEIEIFLYAPGVAQPFLGKTNLLKGNPTSFNNNPAVGGAESTMITVAATGVYTIAVEDSRSPASEVAGTYSIKIVADNPIGPFSVVCDEGPESTRIQV